MREGKREEGRVRGKEGKREVNMREKGKREEGSEGGRVRGVESLKNKVVLGREGKETVEDKVMQGK